MINPFYDRDGECHSQPCERRNFSACVEKQREPGSAGVRAVMKASPMELEALHLQSFLLFLIDVAAVRQCSPVNCYGRSTRVLSKKRVVTGAPAQDAKAMPGVDAGE